VDVVSSSTGIILHELYVTSASRKTTAWSMVLKPLYTALGIRL
jgi:hypothetical protein